MTSTGRAAAAREGQTFGGESLLVRYANLVKLPHTLFALPFALLGVVAASWRYAVTWRVVILVVVAFTAARFVAMAFNRIADRALDARNPRTSGRELPSGRLTPGQAWASVAVAAAVFLWAARALNPLCFALSPVALLWVTAYSYTKRFTHWSHLWLGASLAIAPAGGYLAVAGWVAGFDIFYALQDEQFDRTQGLRSAIVRFGASRAIFVAKLLHAVAIIALAGFGVGAGLGWPYYLGVAIGAAVIAWEHRLVRPGDLRRLDAAFFTANGIVSIVVFLGALGDRLW